ncbi:MAG TPA: lytic transglycosylase domain-containing protein [Acidobacteriaceae bacterium]|nr:lytic transglycosylase domain-containing protein [Acidobacteriaceae bacterium]
MQVSLQRGFVLWIMVALCAMSAQAAERITLRSGFNVVCDHQRPMNGAVRLFLTQTEDNYVDVLPSDIVREEAVPNATPVAMQDRKPLAPSAESSAQNKPVALPVLLEQASAAHHIDVDLLASVIRAESNGNPHAVSRAGAQGLMQLMPGTAAGLGVRDSFAPDQNIAGGTAYLDWLLTRYHDDPALALAAYNAGPEAVDKYHGIPPYAETRLYVARVIHDFNRRKRQLASALSQHAHLGND